MDDTTNITKGVTTTEFWITVGNAVLNFVGVFVALIHPGFHIDPRVQAAVVAFAPLAAMGGTIFYSLSRGKVKAAAVAPASVLVTPAPANNVIQMPTPAIPDLPTDFPVEGAGSIVTKEGETVRAAPRRAPRARKGR